MILAIISASKRWPQASDHVEETKLCYGIMDGQYLEVRACHDTTLSCCLAMLVVITPMKMGPTPQRMRGGSEDLQSCASRTLLVGVLKLVLE